MDFFFSSPAGAIDAAVAAIVCLGVIAFGTHRGRLAALSVLSVYLMDRTIMMGAEEMVWPVLGAAVEFVAVVACLAVIGGLLGRAMAGLYLAKMLAYCALVADFIGFEAMANLATVVVYLQLIVVLTGLSHGGGFIERLRLHHRAGPRDTSGASPVASRVDGN